MGKVTIQSMAEELGLSRNTVSMALKGNEMVAPRTRELVRQYAQEAGYLPKRAQAAEEPRSVREEPGDGETDKNAGGRSPFHRVMILRRSDIAVYWDKVIGGISTEAGLNGCQTQVALVTDEAEREGVLPTGLTDGIEAVFCVQVFAEEYIRKIRDLGIWVFLLDDYKRMKNGQIGDVVKMEGMNAVVALTDHLLGQGMRQIGFLSENSSRFETMYDRYDGYRYAMESAGVVPDPSLVMPDTRSEFFYRLDTFERIVDSWRVVPEAIVCGNDSIAKFLTQALRKKGFRVPEDVAVTGFDNDEEEMLEPFFSTVYVNPKWLGRRLVQCFLWRLRYPSAPFEKVMVEGKVILRRSSVKG